MCYQQNLFEKGILWAISFPTMSANAFSQIVSGEMDFLLSWSAQICIFLKFLFSFNIFIANECHLGLFIDNKIARTIALPALLKKKKQPNHYVFYAACEQHEWQRFFFSSNAIKYHIKK